jgi:hypothetical protein
MTAHRLGSAMGVIFGRRGWTPMLDFGSTQGKRVDQFLQAPFRFQKTRYIGRITILRCNRTGITCFESFEVAPQRSELLDANQNALEIFAVISILFDPTSTVPERK